MPSRGGGAKGRWRRGTGGGVGEQWRRGQQCCPWAWRRGWVARGWSWRQRSRRHVCGRAVVARGDPHPHDPGWTSRVSQGFAGERVTGSPARRWRRSVSRETSAPASGVSGCGRCPEVAARVGRASVQGDGQAGAVAVAESSWPGTGAGSVAPPRPGRPEPRPGCSRRGPPPAPSNRHTRPARRRGGARDLGRLLRTLHRAVTPGVPRRQSGPRDPGRWLRRTRTTRPVATRPPGPSGSEGGS